MSCTCSLIVEAAADADDIAERAIRRVQQLERRWSRFLPDSDVTLLNLNAGSAVRVAPDTVDLIEAMVRGWHATAHCFDPTMVPTLAALGYAASRDDATCVTLLPPAARSGGDPSAIVVDRDANVVMLPPGMAIDPGGIGKGLAADLVVAEVIASGAHAALVELGGDVRVEGEAWTIAVDDRLIALSSGGVATSTTRLRTWTDGGRTQHHLIDPATSQPSTTGTTSCTVIAGTAAWAEAFTKVAFARPANEALAIFAGNGLAASITTDVGRHHTTPAWEDFRR